jgi:hypothetical protein
MKPLFTLLVFLATMAGGRSDTLTVRQSAAGTKPASETTCSRQEKSLPAPHIPTSPSTVQTTAHDAKTIPVATPSAAVRSAEPSREAVQNTTLSAMKHPPGLAPQRTVLSLSVPARIPANPVSPVLKSGWLASPKAPALKPAIPVDGRSSRSQPAAVGGATTPMKANGVVSGNQFGSKHRLLQP